MVLATANKIEWRTTAKGKKRMLHKAELDMWEIAKGSWEQWERTCNRQNCSPRIPSHWVRSHHGMCSALIPALDRWTRELGGSEVNFACWETFTSVPWSGGINPFLCSQTRVLVPPGLSTGVPTAPREIPLNSWAFPMPPWIPGNFQSPQMKRPQRMAKLDDENMKERPHGIPLMLD